MHKYLAVTVSGWDSLDLEIEGKLSETDSVFIEQFVSTFLLMPEESGTPFPFAPRSVPYLPHLRAGNTRNYEGLFRFCIDFIWFFIFNSLKNYFFIFTRKAEWHKERQRHRAGASTREAGTHGPTSAAFPGALAESSMGRPGRTPPLAIWGPQGCLHLRSTGPVSRTRCYV